ncbi:homoserine acetyltransferase family protein [Aaosphaeria arxii CBS 175.79]|uniref:Homoserine acetyltransferase family protein n=1 Tax=Aaosphaeria arxii CBS 175.79 TaxID=1450172 RepID=A0A6A5XE48_9PLEO|nr:homoserine acetyltransferase family protein [Aaosphaeria arxii CBS 175.79]KAF2011159.1 homoserine acetyltransferase family protein [Aaosphaeria arxii CBS 175.79]
MAASDLPSMKELDLNEYKTYKLGNFKLKSGGEIPDAFIAYKTLGDPSLPAIIYPTWYSGLISDNLWLIGSDKTLNPSKYHIIIPALFGNSQSSSPSNNPIRPFPEVLFYDNVRAQHQLVTEHLGVSHARAVLGWSMGAGQTYQWATQYADFMDLVVPFCGSAKTSLHNQVFLEGVRSALFAAKGTSSGGVAKRDMEQLSKDGSGEGKYAGFDEKVKEVGLKALGRVYAGWGFSQAFYRERLYESALGYKDLDDFLSNFWEKWALSKDPENMLVMAHTWQAGDCSAQEPYNGDFKKAMQGIKAKALVLPAKTDLYFPPEDSEIEVQNMREGIGELKVFPSIWGHWAGGPGDNLEDVKWLDDNLREFFEKN